MYNFKAQTKYNYEKIIKVKMNMISSILNEKDNLCVARFAAEKNIRKRPKRYRQTETQNLLAVLFLIVTHFFRYFQLKKISNISLKKFTSNSP